MNAIAIVEMSKGLAVVALAEVQAHGQSAEFLEDITQLPARPLDLAEFEAHERASESGYPIIRVEQLKK